MVVWIGVGVTLAIIALLVIWICRLRWRYRYYRQLAARRPELCEGRQPALKTGVNGPQLSPAFSKDHLIRVDDFLDEASLRRLQQEAQENIQRGIRNYVPTHKKGRSLPYEAMYYHAPTCLAFYHAPVVQNWVSGVVGEQVFPAGDHDQSACSLLIYDQPGDHIGWHFDHNFYKGRQFTVLLSLVNKGSEGGLSASQYQRKAGDGEPEEVDTKENALVVFEGSRVLHRATPTREGDLRIILSMTYNTVPRIHWFRELVRRFKDTAFHGIKALWD